MTRFVGVFLLVTISAYVHLSSACNGYKMRWISVENCLDGDQVISIDKNFTADLSTDCIMSTNGCVTSKGFTSAKIKYSLKKDGNELMTGSPDACDMLDKKNEEQKAKLEMFGFPTECPVPQGRKCFTGDKKVDITKFKDMLPMAAGKITIHSDFEHDTGKSCIESNFEIYKE